MTVRITGGGYNGRAGYRNSARLLNDVLYLIDRFNEFESIRVGLSVPYCELFGGKFEYKESSLVD